MPRFVNAKEKIAKVFGRSALRADPDAADSVPAGTSEAPVEEIPADPDAADSVPALASFALNPPTVVHRELGIAHDPIGAVSFEVGLDKPAPPGGVQVDISGWMGTNLSVQGTDAVRSVSIPEGQMMGVSPLPQRLTVRAATPNGDYELEARLGEVTLTALLHVKQDSLASPFS